MYHSHLIFIKGFGFLVVSSPYIYDASQWFSVAPLIPPPPGTETVLPPATGMFFFFSTKTHPSQTLFSSEPLPSPSLKSLRPRIAFHRPFFSSFEYPFPPHPPPPTRSPNRNRDIFPPTVPSSSIAAPDARWRCPHYLIA